MSNMVFGGGQRSYNFGGQPRPDALPPPPPIPMEAVEPPALPPRAYSSLARNVMIEIERRLPAPGEIVVRPGARVEADSIVARTLVPQPPRLYRLADILDTTPEAAARAMTTAVGERVREGEIIAQRGGLRRATFKAPFAATITAFDPDSGYLSLSPEPQPYSLNAHLRATVADIIPALGVKMRLRASLVRGAFGIGGERHGILKVITGAGEDLQPHHIDSPHSLSIGVAGGSVDAEALMAAVSLKVRGIIAGSIPEQELRLFLAMVDDSPTPTTQANLYRIGQNSWRFPAEVVGTDMPLTLVITEGFGRRAMAKPVHDLLMAYNSEEVSIDGTTTLRRNVRRPEVIIPATTGDDTIVPTPIDQTVRVRSLVRLLSPDYLGMTGRVATIFQTRRPNLPGQFDRSVEVDLPEGRRVTIPLNDIEIIGGLLS